MDYINQASTWYLENLNSISVGLAILFLIVGAVKKFASGGVSKLAEEFLKDELPKLLAAYTFPVVPALLICAFSADKLSSIEGLSLPILVAAAALFWANLQPFK